jgi:hypothetical protein
VRRNPTIQTSKVFTPPYKRLELHETCTLRKCAAYTLDELSRIYRDEILMYAQPIIEKLLTDPNWIVKYATYPQQET